LTHNLLPFLCYNYGNINYEATTSFLILQGNINCEAMRDYLKLRIGLKNRIFVYRLGQKFNSDKLIISWLFR